MPRIERTPIIRTAWQILAASSRITIWQWATRYGRIPADESSKPGAWQPHRARLFRHALEVVSARITGKSFRAFPHATQVRFIMFCGPSQIGKTKSFLHPIICFCVDIMRTNMAFLTHKGKQIKQHLRLRLMPMFEETPRLARYLPASKSLRRELLSGNVWQLQGANLHALCANVASDLREYSQPVGIMDEPEAYDLNVEGEGDPIELFLDRQKRYQDTSILAGASTPNSVTGHTWSKLCGSLHLRLMVRCLHCGQDQYLHVDQLRPTDTTATPDEIEAQDLARWHCVTCDAPHTSADVDTIVAHAIRLHRWIPGVWQQDEHHPAGYWSPGKTWRQQADGQRMTTDLVTWRPSPDVDDHGDPISERHQIDTIAWPVVDRIGYQCNYLYDPDCSCGRFLAHELRARHGSAEEWHTHVTGWRAEPVIIAGDLLDTDSIVSAGSAPYCWGSCPHDGRWLLITADQQGNTVSTIWFAYETRIVDPGGESWLIDAGAVHGLDGLRNLERKTYPIGARARSADRVAIDGANGNLARELRAWALESYAELTRTGIPADIARARTRRILLIGDEKLSPDLPWIERIPTKRDRIHHHPGIRIFRWNIAYWKDRTHRRLQRAEGLPALHIPTDDADRPRDLARWLKSCTSEERVMRAIGMPGGRQRHAIVWQPRCYVDPRGRSVERSDTHWWQAACMADVLCDLIGAYVLPGVEDAPETPTAPTKTSVAVSPTARPAANRPHSRLDRLHRRRR